MKLRAVMIALAACAMFIGPVDGQISWRSTTDRQPPASPSASVGKTVQEQLAAGRRHVLARFTGPVTPEMREAMRSAGVELLTFVGDNAFFAALSTERLQPAALERISSLCAIQGVEREHKLHPMLAKGLVPPWSVVAMTDDEKSAKPEEVVAVYLVFHRDVAIDPDGVSMCYRYGAKIRSMMYSINAAVIELPYSRIEALAAEDSVQWIEPPLPGFDVVNEGNRVLTQANLAQAAPYNLTGEGVTVMVYDGGTGRPTHVDFQGRLHVRDSSGMASHSSHVAGTIGGAGVANPTYKGMAPGVTLEAYGFEVVGGLQPGFLYTDPGDLETDYDQAINTYGAVIANNSIGSNVERNGYDCTWQGDYGATAALIDAIVRGSLGQPFRIVWANGNERTGRRCDVEGYGEYYSVAPPNGAKNHITVGAVNSDDDSMTWFSSWGPVDDGRLKPDISAPGCQNGGGVTSCGASSDTAYGTLCGTSMACPTTTGVAALLLQDFRAQFPQRPDFRNSTLKILLAHCAVDRGNVGPDYQFGYGSIRVKDTIDFMRTGSFLEAGLDQGGTYSVNIQVSAGEPVLKVTLAWDDAPAAPAVTNALVNDLDLRVYDPSNMRHYPWTLNPTNPSAPAVQTAEDHINNIEQVLVNSPAAGTWRVEVYGYNVPEGPQPFSLCASPSMVACSSKGRVWLDAAQYGCNGTIGLRVVDCDLNANSSVAETVTVTAMSTTEPAGESVVLTETGPDTADFRGTIGLSPTDSPGVLQVAHEDTVTAQYLDADDGLGGHNVVVTASAMVDCQGPVISNVQTTGIVVGMATITFTTSEVASGLVRYGLSCGSLSSSAGDVGYGTSHSITLSGVPDGSLVYYAVEATDQSGNTGTDDNAGACYSFKTPGPVLIWNLDTDPGWTVEGQWAYGTPTGGSGDTGGPDPTSGHTGDKVYGYNLSGGYSDSMSEESLTTTRINCRNLTQLHLRFWRWLGVEQRPRDHAPVRVSNDGVNWNTLWENGAAAINDTSWSQQDVDISAFADDKPIVYIRWTMGVTDDSTNYCGWNIDDVEIWGIVTIIPDVSPPIPDPMTFETAPAPVDRTSITMTATTATDAGSPPVYYYFDMVAGGPGGDDSGWQLDTTYTDTGLVPNTGYAYRVKARDSAEPTPYETAYSSPDVAIMMPIETPTGISFGAVNTSSIVLNAAGILTNLTTGSSGVYFNSTTSGGNGGINDWLQATTDTATGLSPNTNYLFQVKARNQNGVETAYIAAVAKATRANVPAAPTLSGATRTTLNLDVNVGSNPASTECTIMCTGSTPIDPSWNGKYVSATGTARTAPVWRADAQWAVTTVKGLQPCTTYTFAVKARNSELVETAFSSGASSMAGRLGDMNGDGDVDGDDIQAFVACAISSGSGCACANMSVSAFVSGLIEPMK